MYRLLISYQEMGRSRCPGVDHRGTQRRQLVPLQSGLVYRTWPTTLVSLHAYEIPAIAPRVLERADRRGRRIQVNCFDTIQRWLHDPAAFSSSLHPVNL